MLREGWHTDAHRKQYDHKPRIIAVFGSWKSQEGLSLRDSGGMATHISTSDVFLQHCGRISVD